MSCGKLEVVHATSGVEGQRCGTFSQFSARSPQVRGASDFVTPWWLVAAGCRWLRCCWCALSWLLVGARWCWCGALPVSGVQGRWSVDLSVL